MSLWKIAWRSMQRRALSSFLTGVSMALGVALVISVLVIYEVIDTQFKQGGNGFDLIVGAKGGKLQLVLNTVYHLSQPIENVPYSFYKEFTEGKFASSTAFAIPLCMGDSFQGGGHSFRVIGTTPDLFDKVEYGRVADSSPQGFHALKYEFSEGRNFRSDHYFEAVIGALVARRTGLKVGDHFQPSHGIAAEGADLKKHVGFEIVGVLEPSGTPNDRALFVNIEGFYLLENHAKPLPEGVTLEEVEHHDDHGHAHSGSQDAASDPNRGHKPLPEIQREVTAILVLMNNPLVSQSIFTMINEGQEAQAVFPTREITLFFNTFVGPVRIILLALTVLIVVVAGIGIMVSIYNSMSDRTQEIAVMRALGASRTTVTLVILFESILLCLLGGLGGVFLGHTLMGILSPYVLDQTGVTLHFLQFDAKELILILGLVLLATLVGFLPAMTAYRTDVARSLSP